MTDFPEHAPDILTCLQGVTFVVVFSRVAVFTYLGEKLTRRYHMAC
jgi:hypothetical protein